MENYARRPSASSVGGNSTSGNCSKSDSNVACTRLLDRARRSSSRSKVPRRARIRACRPIRREGPDRHRSSRQSTVLVDQHCRRQVLDVLLPERTEASGPKRRVEHAGQAPVGLPSADNSQMERVVHGRVARVAVVDRDEHAVGVASARLGADERPPQKVVNNVAVGH
jgi:hypothetical protein